MGDNLYSDSILALDAKTGKLKWYFQFTPHDVWDYDAQETPALIDANWQGKPRKLLVQANRNGFFYVLDRTNGEFLLGTQYVKNVTWATGLTAARAPDSCARTWSRRSKAGACARRSKAPRTGTRRRTILRRACTTCRRTTSAVSSRRSRWSGRPARGYMGGSFVQAPDEPAQRVLRAIDIQTGKVAWELPQVGPVTSWGGTLSTAGGLVILRRRQRRA